MKSKVVFIVLMYTATTERPSKMFTNPIPSSCNIHTLTSSFYDWSLRVIDLWLRNQLTAHQWLLHVAALLLKKNIAIKKFKIVHRVANWRFNIVEITVRPPKNILKNFMRHIIFLEILLSIQIQFLILILKLKKLSLNNGEKSVF